MGGSKPRGEAVYHRSQATELGAEGGWEVGWRGRGDGGEGLTSLKVRALVAVFDCYGNR